MVFQHIPRAVTVAFPSLVTFPPPEAVVWVMLVIAAVVTVGKDSGRAVVKVTIVPYAVP